MDCPNHKEYPDCPYIYKYQILNLPGRGGKFTDMATCSSTPCNWNIEKQQEEILKLMRDGK